MAASFEGVNTHLTNHRSDSRSHILSHKPSAPEWVCATCTFLNKATFTECALCLTPRTKTKPTTIAKPLKPKPINTKKPYMSGSEFNKQTVSHISHIPLPPSSKRSKSAPRRNNKSQTPTPPQRTRPIRSKSPATPSKSKPKSKYSHISNMFFTPKKSHSPHSPLSELFELATVHPPPANIRDVKKRMPPKTHRSRHKKKASFLAIASKKSAQSSKNRKGRSRRTKSILILKEKPRKHVHNLSNAFFSSSAYKHEDQIKLTKSTANKKRLSIHKRSSKSGMKLFPSAINIALPTDNSLMKQSQTSPINGSFSPLELDTKRKQSKERFLAPLSRQITLYKLPAEKHKVLPSHLNPDKHGCTTSLPTNFSYASLVYNELQQRFQKRGKHSPISLKLYEESVQKHESTLLEILKQTNDNNADVIDTIINARCDVLCHFLPLIAFTLCQCDVNEWKMKLLHKFRDRIVGQSDLRQAVRFFIGAYSDIMCVKCVFAGLCPDGDLDIDMADCKDSESKNIDKDVVGFWYNIASNKHLQDNDYFTIGMNTMIRDPVKQLSSPLRRVLVRKIINSNSKPLLIDCFALDKGNGEFLSSTCILKYGDDLRKDKSCMLVFKWMNHLFSKLDDTLNAVKCLTYNVIPMGRLFGCIQLIPDCIPLRDVLSLKGRLTEKLAANLIATAAGSYIGAYTMGIRDRHFDNILIRTTDCTLFHIDMNYVLGDTITGLDANRFGITKKFYDLLGKERYNTFIDLSCKVFIELRRHCRELINFVCLAFSYIYNYQKIRRYVFKQLRMNESHKKSANWLRIQLKNAPFNRQTQLKNTIHKFATR